MKVVYIPEGIPNIKDLFEKIDFNKIKSWKLSACDKEGKVLATTRKNILMCCSQIRIHFINSLGEIDSINFHKVQITQETKSETWLKSQNYPLDRTKGGTYRKNITSNDIYEGETNLYGEKYQYWIKEISNSPKAWIEMDLPNGFSPSIKKEYLPIVISDTNLIVRKPKDRHEYLFKIKFTMSNPNINLR